MNAPAIVADDPAALGVLKIRNARLKSLIDIGLDLSAERDPDQLLQRVCTAARLLFGATYVTLGILDDDKRALQRFLAFGAEISRGIDAANWIAATDGLPEILAIVVNEQRPLRGGNPVKPDALPPVNPAVQAYLAVPISSPARVYGWMLLVCNEGRLFADDDEHLAMALAGQVGRIYEVEQEIIDRKVAEADARHEWKRAQESAEALRVSEERIRFALEAADVGIWDMNHDTGVLTCSERGEAQFGLAPGTFGRTAHAFLQLVHPDDRTSVNDAMSTAFATMGDFRVEFRTVWPDGSTHWLVGTGREYPAIDAKPKRALGIFLDVTERHHLDVLYQQAQKMEAVGLLAAGVAHDFNNVLTAILGYCELLLGDLAASDPHAADVAEIQKAGQSAAMLTRQLLALSRKQIVEPAPLDLNGVVTDMRSMLGRLIRENVRVVLNLKPALALVTADRGHIEQILVNLAVNAQDAMTRGGTLTIETDNVELDEVYAKAHGSVAPGSYVALTVTDTGTGITPAVQARLFEPFFTTKEFGQGTGLGLATVHGIVARSGGTVEVFSEMGKGTSFKVYFPKADVAAVVEAPRPVVLSPTGTETVLVVEDAAGLRDLSRRMLKKQGYTVLVAANADDAQRVFDEHGSIDVLLTDVVMPGTSGPELMRQLLEQRPDLKVVFMSGYTRDAIVRHGLLNPGIAFVNKPFTAEVLGRKIREALDR